MSVLTASWSLRLEQPIGQYHYSNIGYLLVGAMIEKEGECSFRECMDSFLSTHALSDIRFDPRIPSQSRAFGIRRVDDQVEVLPPEWYASAYSAPFSGAWASAEALARFGALVLRSAEMSKRTEPGYGLGVFHQTRSGERTMSHDGAAAGFLSQLAMFPERPLAIAVLTNGGGEPDPQIEKFAGIIQRILEASLAPDGSGWQSTACGAADPS